MTERRISISEDIVRPQLLTLRDFRPFKTSDEYLWAMKEDLSDWLNLLYPELRIRPETFMECLETGVTLCKVTSFHISLTLSRRKHRQDTDLPLFRLSSYILRLDQKISDAEYTIEAEEVIRLKSLSMLRSPALQIQLIHIYIQDTLSQSPHLKKESLSQIDL